MGIANNSIKQPPQQQNNRTLRCSSTTTIGEESNCNKTIPILPVDRISSKVMINGATTDSSVESVTELLPIGFKRQRKYRRFVRQKSKRTQTTLISDAGYSSGNSPKKSSSNDEAFGAVAAVTKISKLQTSIKRPRSYYKTVPLDEWGSVRSFLHFVKFTL